MTLNLSSSKYNPPKKTGLALGSGSARGWAHIGVIRALAKLGIRVDCVAGTSIGAMVGAAYASGKIDVLEDIVLQLDWKQILYFFDIVFPRSGLIDGKKVADFIRNHLGEIDIENLRIPFSSVSTELATGNEVTISSGDIIEAVRASISIPGIFTPVRKNGMILVDGGLVNPVPVSTVREMGADFVIAVDLSHHIVSKKGIKKTSVSRASNLFLRTEGHQGHADKRKILKMLNEKIGKIDLSVLTHIKQWISGDPLPNIFEVLINSIYIMETQITAVRLKNDPPDVLIRPNLGHIRFPEFNRAQEAIREGYNETILQVSPLIEKGGRLGHT